MSEARELLLGTALSVYQNSGDPHSNWGHFERRRGLLGSPIRGGQTIGASCDFWNRYEEDIARARALGSNALRLSLEWSRIEPVRGQRDEAAIRRYHEIFECIREHGMRVVLTLHHFVHPQWFEQLGAFERECNLALFVDFCAWAFDEYRQDVELWTTFNEPTILVLMGYVFGAHPPGKHLRLRLAAEVLRNLMVAHNRAYRAIKARPGGQASKVGMVHNILDFEGLDGPLRGYTRAAARFMNASCGTDAVTRFLQTGHFHVSWPGVQISYEDEPLVDYIGLNYYSRVILGPYLNPTCLPGEQMTDMPYAAHPGGIYDAIARVGSLGVPIYITENGIADARDDRRAQFIQSYLAQVERAIADGHDVRGYFYWTLTDNFEWNVGFSMKFGLFEVDMDSQHRRLRPGAQALVDAFARLSER